MDYITQTFIQKGRPCYACFVDLEQAFDSVPHASLWFKLQNLGVSTKLIKIIQSICSQTTVTKIAENQLPFSIIISKGVLQGHSLSPIIFNLYLADLPQQLDNNLTLRIPYTDTELLLLQYF